MTLRGFNIEQSVKEVLPVEAVKVIAEAFHKARVIIGIAQTDIENWIEAEKWVFWEQKRRDMRSVKEGLVE